MPDCYECGTDLDIEDRGGAPPIGHCPRCGNSWYLDTGPGSVFASLDEGGVE